MTDLRQDAHERPSAEAMLARVRREAGAGARGRHRIYLGMAPGVGKTYAALQELRRRKERGTDAVIGFVETYSRPHTIAALGGLEIIPRKLLPYKGVTVEELDTQAVIRRAPAIALVDELAHTNAPGSEREKRWQDVQALLDAGITVISTINVQHIESLSDIVESVTGVQVRERVPDWVFDQADEVELVDMSPHALRQRLRHGNVYSPERAEQALQRFFQEGNLTALRELALRTVARRVEQDLVDYTREHRLETTWAPGERVMVCVDDQPRSQHLIRRAWRRAERLKSGLIAVFVETPAWATASPEARQRLADNLRFAEDLGAEVCRVAGSNVANALMRLAHDRNVDSIVIGHSRHGRLHELFQQSVVHRLLRLGGAIDIHVVGDRSEHRVPSADR